MTLSTLHSFPLAVLLLPHAPQDGRAAGEEDVIPLHAEVALPMVWVPPGTFVMGSPPDEEGRSYSYLPDQSEWNTPAFDTERQHEVTLTRGVFMGQTEVTQGAWEAVMGSNPSHHAAGPEFPVENVSWNDVQDFLARVNTGRTDGRFRLPTEAEWEYACRAGTRGEFAGDRDAIAWTRANSPRRSHAVATRDPNPWGLFDMHGNVTEWCHDLFGEYPKGPVTDPAGASEEEARSERNGQLVGRRLSRGGAFTGRVLHCRSADRGAARPDTRDFYMGFRLVFEEAVRTPEGE